VLCVVLFFPLGSEVHWYAANAAFVVITLYMFQRVLTYSSLPRHLIRADKGFIVQPLLALGVVLIPAALNFLYRIESYLPNDQYRAIGRLATLACLAILVICLILIVVSAPTSDTGAFSEYVSLPVTVLSLVVFLGSDEVFGYLTHIISPEVADLNLTLRNMVAATIGLVIFFDFVRVWFGRGHEFSRLISNSQNSVPRRRNGEEISIKTGPLTTADTMRLAFHTVMKYPILVVRIIGKFLIILIYSALYSLLSLLFTKRFALGLLFSVLVFTTLVIENGSGIIMNNLADVTMDNLANAVVVVSAIVYVAWTLLIVFSYATLCYGRYDGLFQSWLLVLSLSLCGLWLASLILHVAVAFGWLAAPGFAFSLNNPFFWFISGLGLLGLAFGGRQVWGEQEATTDRSEAP
jgi:hypothetical protein